MIDDNHVCFCPLLQWKKPFEVFLSIFVICCQECCKKHNDVEETKTTIFQNLLNFQKQVILRKNVNFGRPEIGSITKNGFESINYSCISSNEKLDIM